MNAEDKSKDPYDLKNIQIYDGSLFHTVDCGDFRAPVKHCKYFGLKARLTFDLKLVKKADLNKTWKKNTLREFRLYADVAKAISFKGQWGDSLTTHDQLKEAYLDVVISPPVTEIGSWKSQENPGSSKENNHD